MPAATAQAARHGAHGFDTEAPLTQAHARDRVTRGFSFCLRYVSRTPEARDRNAANGITDLTADEAALIVASGLALMVVQHVAPQGWAPAGALGAEYGTNAATYAKAAELAAGTTLWLDLEGVAPHTQPEDVIAYANAWFAEVKNAGYQPGLYVGANAGLTGDALFFRLATQSYWRAAGDIPDIAHRGYQMFQHLVPGQPYDQNVIMADALGGLPFWMAAR